ncbi:FAD-dependent 5-carboxymethylaminomethyl-2-thiouridine(34) oxidoreductase MnmC [Variovorax sp. YR216]|uniref:FAD-dependent 5-carboxymethylaminomethyl-2-thiouridine(34) oxidoreductase MnmC n=1 Tax=Variovorax sp. YR216 TaxID=1882828 RepID=UPI00089AA72C|nr:FAD-dependent 5-carboxymethylaminomethyl-2-thiouridine(34) oxidoreductase MnmC [Variovorax sp. YR216]SEA00693.1 tRNA 5-methylaminomethyl-2-thiouridine biosynthesis bifunctional protein [Variovorax sp. YR216]
MAEPVEWRADGIPRSARFDDIYHSESGGAAQARYVFLGGCGLPAAWSGKPQWRILETGFGFGLNFLTTWQAWRADPNRCRLLHFVSIEAYPVSRDDLLRAAASSPELLPLARELAAQWHGLLPGFHRIWLDKGQVLLTLCIGDVQPMLRAQRFDADSIYLDGFSPQRNPQMWSAETLKSASRFARRGTRIATWTIARTVRDALAQCGFKVAKTPGLPPKRDCLHGVYDPAWELRRRDPSPEEVTQPGHCIVIGAGLAGAAVASSLARRGWSVTVLDASAQPATGASSLPVGVLAPHVSPDDALLSRLTRAGIRAVWPQLGQWLVEGRDWGATGVVERRAPGDARLPAGWSAEGPNESWLATAEQLHALGLPADAKAIRHVRAGWVRPARLVKAWLAQPGIRVETGRHVTGIERSNESTPGWIVRGENGEPFAQADKVVIAAGFDSRILAPDLPLQPVRGQVAWGVAPHGSALPAVPINGDGHLIAQVPDDGGELWLTGATFDRDSDDPALRPDENEVNLEKLRRLHPDAAAHLFADFQSGRVHAWAGIRCASGDRRPLVGPLRPDAEDGVWVCTALGSRGMSFAALCAELLAARWHGEPLPLPAKLASALDTRRVWARPPTQKLSSAP